MRVLFDTDILIDYLTKRPPFAQEVTVIWEANRQGFFEGYFAAIAPINIFYILRKAPDLAAARQAVQDVLAAFQACPVDQAVLQVAFALPFKDYEDAVQNASAAAMSLDAIVPRNLKDYKGATIPVFSPTDFIKQLPPIQP